MREVLISIQPKWCELIASGKKTVEVRKTRPKIDTPFKCYIYCTLSGSNEFFKEDCKGDIAEWNKSKMTLKKGKVIGEFVCDRISPIYYTLDGLADVVDCNTTCLNPKDFIEYGKGKTLYGWHISDLVIYDKPKELSEFFMVGHSEYCKSEWKKREILKLRLEKCNEITRGKAHLNTDSDFENIIKMLSPFKIKRPPQSWCYVELLKGGAE